MNLVTQARLARGFTMEEVAKAACVAEGELRWIERGGVPRLQDAIRLTQFFDCECDELFPDTERHRKTFKKFADGKIPSEQASASAMPEFDVDPRFWFFCVRLCGQWRRIFIRSQTVQKIRSVLAVDLDSFLAVESCGYHLVLNCNHVSAYEIVARNDSSWISSDFLDERDLYVLFADGSEGTFRFHAPDAIGDGLDQLEFQAPSAEPCLELGSGPIKVLA